MSESEFWIWLRHEQHQWLPARVLLPSFPNPLPEGTPVSLLLPPPASNTVEFTVPAHEPVTAIASTVRSTAPDLITLEELGEPAIVHVIRNRYAIDAIYTYVGDILVAVNPFKQIASIYSADMLELYKSNRHSAGQPHIYAISANAYSHMVRDAHDQAIIISGESGAGKTESTKISLQFIGDIANSVDGAGVEEQIMMSNPVLEAFGNAKTLRNDNSSRFGKWMDIIFDRYSKRISGAEISCYLLEKSRVVSQASGERSFHVFYQLCEGAQSEIRQLFHIRQASDFEYLRKSGCYQIDQVNDTKDFERLQKALHTLHFSDEEIKNIFRTLSGILHLGNIQIEDVETMESSSIKNALEAKVVAEIFGLTEDALNSAICERALKVRNELQKTHVRAQQAADSRDAIAKALYSNLFDWIVFKINDFLNVKQTNYVPLYIGILDIFGFEVFEKNSFEQFFINMANEHLQNHFIHHFLVIEQEEYSQEKILNDFVSYEDNSEVMNLLGNMINSMDEEILLPKANDSTLMEKMNTKFSAGRHKSKCFAFNLLKPNEFTVKHYAGFVTYDVTGFLEKNKDTLNDWSVQCFTSSAIPFISQLLPLKPNLPGSTKDLDTSEPRNLSASYRRLSGKFSSVRKKSHTTLGSNFRAQLEFLIGSIEKRSPHFIRCLKPNFKKIPHCFDSELILNQLKYSGMMEVARIRASGFSYRRSFEKFCARYRPLVDRKQRTLPITELTRLIIKNHVPEQKQSDIQIGISKVFIRENALRHLDDLLSLKRTAFVVKLQAISRKFIYKRKYLQMKSILKLSAQYMDKGDFGSLSKLIEEAESKKLDLYIGHKLKTEFGYLEQERRVYDIISSALLKGSFDELDAGQKQAEAIGVLNKTKSPDMIDLLKRAAEQRNVFLLHGQIRSKLEAAIIAEDLKSLEDTCLEAKQALMYHAVLDRAENLAIELKHDQRTFEELQNALNGHEMERMALFHFEASKCTRLNEERIKLLDECSKNLTEYFQQKLQNAIQKKTEEALVPILQLVEKSTIKQNVIKDFDVAESLLKSILEQQKHAEKQKFSLQKELLAKLEKKKQPDVKKPDPIPESVQESKPVELKNDEINVVQDDAQVPTVSDPAKENDEKEKSKVESKNNSQDIAAVNTEPEVLKRLEIDENKTSEKDKNDVDEDARKFATIRQKVQQFQLNSDNKNTDTVKSTERSISDDFKPDSVRLKIYNFQQQAKIQPMVNEMMEHQKSMDSAKEEMTKYVSEKNIEGLRNFISNLPKDPYFVRVLFTARENLQHMELEKKLLEELAEYVSLLDVTRMKEILNNLAEFEISRSSHKTIEEARRLCFATTSVELFAMKFNRAVEKGDAAALRELLPYAKENMIEEKEIRLASMWLNQQNIREWTSISSIMINETKNVMALIENLRNSSALQNYEGLRSADDFLKIAAYFSKKHISPHKMYVWQKELIQKSMLSFSNVEKSKQKSSSNDAKNCFKNVQMFMRDRYHPFPVSVAYDILRCAAENQNLQDELFCQLIKQTTENPSSESLLLGWKLLYICISTFPVQNESLFGVLSSHIANHIPKVVPSDYDSWIDSIESIAMVSFKTLRKMKRTEIVSIPSMETVRSIAESRLPIIKAKYPDSQVIEIRLRSSQMTVSDFCSYAFEYGKTSMFYYKLVVHVQDQSDVFHCDPDQSMVSVYLHWETQLRTGNIQAYSFELVILSKAASNDQIMPEESKSVQDVFNESNLPKTLERKATRRKSSARSNTDFNENPEDDNIRLDIECFENESKGLVPKKRIVNITNFLRRLVSKKKKRLQDSGFDLDLSYITDRIIAMGYPAEDSSFQSNYRNPYSEVYTFLEKFHAKNYKVYSLCAEYDYGTMKFNGSVAKYPFKDHQCPAFHVLIDCCEDLSHWLEQDGDHIAAVHCKAGKGRTGMMISCYLLYSQQCETAEEALHFFAEHRTLNHKGVAIPSQIRFVHYFQLYMYYILKSGLKLPKESPQCIIETISFSSVPNFSTNGGCHPYLVIRNAEDYIIFDSRSVSSPRHVSPSKSETPIEIGSGGVVVQGDLLFEFKNCDPLIKDSTMCHFWINTFFLPHSGKLNLKKFEIDGASKDVKNRRFSEDFCIKLRFSMLTASPIITFVSHN